MTIQLVNCATKDHMEDILLVNRKSNHKAFEHGAVWKTCLRQVLICDEQELCEHALLDNDLVLQGEDAYHFLIEVLCGLQSPIIGETEVLGQFRLFVEARKSAGDTRFFDNQKWLQFIFSEVKRIRTEHLVGIGSHSYGSLLRRFSKESDSISLLGSGHLASEIIPWLSHKKELSVFARSPEKAWPLKEKIPHLQVHSLKCHQELNETIIIAAPISDEFLVAKILNSKHKVRTVYDLRGELNNLEMLLSKEVGSQIQVIPLKEFFSTLEHHKLELENKVKEIQEIIRERSLAFVNRIELRPHGWDDICA